MSVTQPKQIVLDFDDVADSVILVAVDGREVEVPRHLVVAVPGTNYRYLRPESVLEAAPSCAAPLPRGWSQSSRRRQP